MNQNAATTIAALLVLNAGLFVSNQARDLGVHAATRAQVTAARAEACKAKIEARAAAVGARIEARQAAREAIRVRHEVQKAAMMAPASSRPRVSVADYVRCVVNSSVRSIVNSN